MDTHRLLEQYPCLLRSTSFTSLPELDSTVVTFSSAIQGASYCRSRGLSILQLGTPTSGLDADLFGLETNIVRHRSF